MNVRYMKKVAIITGSTSGIGAAIARTLASAGFHLVINSSTSVAEGKKFVKELPNAIYVKANVAKENECNTVITETLEQFGQIDVLINNAAYSSRFVPHTHLDEQTDELFLGNFEVNVMGSWYLSRLAFPHLQQSSQGQIINISSIAGIRPIGSSIPYAVSKAALNHLTLLLAKAMSPKVRVNAILPGFIDTPRTNSPTADKLREKNQESSLLKRAGMPDEIAMAVLSLIQCELINGQLIAVDGGTSINL